jgi:hypothetical protein
VSAAERAERVSLAIVGGRVSAEDMEGARETLRLALREAETERAAAALRAYRAGEPVWAWPARAPWAGF